MVTLLAISGCVHSPPPVITKQINSQTIQADAANDPTMAYWKDLRIDYYRDGKFIYWEWGYIFSREDGSGRILLYSPNSNQIDTRSYIFSGAILDTEKPKVMRHLINDVALKGWNIKKVDYVSDDHLLTATAYPTSYQGETGEIEIALEFLDLFFNVLWAILEINLH